MAVEKDVVVMVVIEVIVVVVVMVMEVKVVEGMLEVMVGVMAVEKDVVVTMVMEVVDVKVMVEGVSVMVKVVLTANIPRAYQVAGILLISLHILYVL